jgi:hypothetical protein
VELIAGLDDVEKRKFLTLPGLELLPLGRPARSQSLYRLRYPGDIVGGMKLKCRNISTFREHNLHTTFYEVRLNSFASPYLFYYCICNEEVTY